MPAGLVGPVRAKPLVLEDGTIGSGSPVESYRSWAVWIERQATCRCWTRISGDAAGGGDGTALAGDDVAVADHACALPWRDA